MHMEFTARVRMNDLESPADGGRLLLHCDDSEVRKAGCQQVEVIVNALTDAVLAQFPSTKADKATRRFRVIIDELE